MPDRSLIYWIKFDKEPKPLRISKPNVLEFLRELEYLCHRYEEVPEWIIRDYK